MPETPPNVVLIVVDDADRKVLEHEASSRIRNAIAGAPNGATATRYLLSHPICAPSRATMLTGRYSHTPG